MPRTPARRSPFACRAVASLALLATVAAGPPTAPKAAAGPVTFELAVYLPHRPTATLAESLRAVHDDGFADLAVVDAPPPPAGPALHGRAVPIEQYAVPDLDRLKFCGIGLSAEQGQQLQKATDAWVLDFGVVDPAEAVPLVRRSAQFVAALADRLGGDAAGVVVWDESTRQAFSVKAWREHRVDGWSADGLPDVAAHVTIHLYKPDQQSLPRAITLGMQKFGRPDLVIQQLPQTESGAGGHLINAVAQLMVERPPADAEAATFAVDLSAIRHPTVRKRYADRAGPGATGRATLSLVPAQRDEGDPENALVRLGFDHAPGATDGEQLAATLAAVGGSTDHIVGAKASDAELNAARDRARQKLPGLQADVARGLPAGESVSVKAPFKAPDGGVEYMWVEVTRWDGAKITGVLQNDPDLVPGLKAGATVTADEGEVFDYLRRKSDGSTEGNETGRILQRRADDGDSPTRR